jgi:ABC-type uncharacterized transport system auxiliary subunit
MMKAQKSKKSRAMKTAKIGMLTSTFLVIFSLGACSGLTHSDRPAEKTWWLEPYTHMSGDKPSGDEFTLALSVSTVPGLDSDRILTLSSNLELNHYSGARWVDNLPELVSSLTRRSLQAWGRFKVVEPGHAVINADCELRLEVTKFYARLGITGQSQEIRVSIDGHYRCHGEALSPIALDASIPVGGNRMSTIVAAFQQGINSALAELPDQMSKEPGNGTGSDGE